MTVSKPGAAPVAALLAASLMLMLPAPGGAQTGIPAGPAPPAETRRDIVFASPAGIDLALDIAFVPGAPGPRPLLVYLPANSYGGTVPFGNDTEWKGRWTAAMKDAVAKGFVAAAVNLRPLAALERAGVSYPLGAMVDDTRAALAWLSAHAADYGIDTARMALLGWSSGAHIALAAAYGAPGSSLAPPSAGTPAVAAVVSSAAILDFEAMWKSDGALPNAIGMLNFDARLAGGRLEERPEAFRAASPARFVGPATPPTMLLHGGRDQFVPAEQARIGDAALAAAGVRHSMILFPERQHVSLLRMPEVWAFLAAELQGK